MFTGRWYLWHSLSGILNFYKYLGIRDSYKYQVFLSFRLLIDAKRCRMHCNVQRLASEKDQSNPLYFISEQMWNTPDSFPKREHTSGFIYSEEKICLRLEKLKSEILRVQSKQLLRQICITADIKMKRAPCDERSTFELKTSTEPLL